MSESARNNYVLLGGAEHLEWFEALQKPQIRNDKYFWTVPKDVKLSEFAFVYLTAPVSRIVGRVLIVGEPFLHYENTMFDNKKMRNKYCAEILPVIYIPFAEELTIRGLKHLFGKDWGWCNYPRSNTKIPNAIFPAFWEIVKSAILKEEIL